MLEKDMDVYRDLQRHLDKMPVGFPTTDSGIELKVLKHLFTSEEADLALNLDFMPISLNKIFRRVKKSGIKIDELERKLDQMYNKGLIHYGKREDEKYYANAPLVIGMFEFQLKRLSKEFIIDVKQYFKEAFFEREFNITGIPQLRTIPIEQSIPHEQNIASYDDLRQIIDTCEGPIAVAECICRKSKDLLGDPCKKTDLREICFSFRNGAQMYHDKGMARLISKEEALDILNKVEESGLVLQPGNSQRPMCICCCCGCCCEVLTNQKRFDEPSKLFATNYFAEVDLNLCKGCGICVERCNMDAIEIIDEKSKINVARCIGCGVCVPTCSQDAISLKRKQKETIPPINTAATYMNIMDKKAELARMK